MQKDIISPAVLNKIIEDLRVKGYSIQDDLLPSYLIDALEQEGINQPDEQWHNAGIGRQQNFQIAKNIRRDKIFWIDGGTQTAECFLSAMEQLKTTLNRKLLLGLFDYEAHFAQYPVGGFYEKHLDAFKGKGNRILSTVLYLNSDWKQTDGGELILYDEEYTDKEIGRFIPQKGRFVIFLSECFYHQVNIANKQRYSIAGWFRVNNSLFGKIDSNR